MKRKLLNSFIILTSSTLLSKIFSLANRMLLSRTLSSEAMSLYILIIPTLSLCITLSQFSLPSAVFRLISNPSYNNKKVMITSFILSALTSSLMIIGLLFFSRIISFQFLKNKEALYPLLAMIPFIPLVALSGIIKNYFLGKEDVWHLSVSTFIEEISRIILSYYLITRYHYYSNGILVSFIILAMCLGELLSILYLSLFIKHKIPFHFIDKDNLIFKDIMNISLPLTGSRLLHSFYNFIEPIILIMILTHLGISEKTIHYQYGILSGYVISLLLIPTFFNNVILRLLIPILNKDLAQHKKKNMQNHILLSLLSCFLISLPFTFIFYNYGDYLLILLYNTNEGYQYLKYMSIPFTLFYLQTPLSATLQVLNKNRLMLYMSILEITIEFIFLLILTPIYHIFTIAIVLNIGLMTTLCLCAYFVYQYVYI